MRFQSLQNSTPISDVSIFTLIGENQMTAWDQMRLAHLKWPPSVTLHLSTMFQPLRIPTNPSFITNPSPVHSIPPDLTHSNFQLPWIATQSSPNSSQNPTPKMPPSQSANSKPAASPPTTNPNSSTRNQPAKHTFRWSCWPIRMARRCLSLNPSHANLRKLPMRGNRLRVGLWAVFGLVLSSIFLFSFSMVWMEVARLINCGIGSVLSRGVATEGACWGGIYAQYARDL